MKNIKEISISRGSFIKLMDTTQKKNYDFELTRLKLKCDKESSGIKNSNIFSGGGMGAAIGIVASASSSIVGIPVSSPEIMILVASSMIFGVLAGLIIY